MTGDSREAGFGDEAVGEVDAGLIAGHIGHDGVELDTHRLDLCVDGVEVDYLPQGPGECLSCHRRCKASGGDHRVVVAGAGEVVGGDRPQTPGQVCWISTDEGQAGGVVVEKGETRGQVVDKGRVADRALGNTCLQPEAHDFTDRYPIAAGVGLGGEPSALDGTQSLTHHRLAGALAVVVDAAAAVPLTVLSTGAPRCGAAGGVAAGPIGRAGARQTGVGDVGGVGKGGAGLNGGQHHARVGETETLAVVEPINLEINSITVSGTWLVGDRVVDD